MIGHIAETAGHDEPKTRSVTMDRNPRSRCRNHRSRWSEIRIQTTGATSDNGPEYISATLLHWASGQGIRIEHIQPGKPQQNAYVERFNRTVRYEWLSQYYWSDLDEVREYAAQWMWRYNHERPNMALGGITPKQRLAMAA